MNVSQFEYERVNKRERKREGRREEERGRERVWTDLYEVRPVCGLVELNHDC